MYQVIDININNESTCLTKEFKLWINNEVKSNNTRYKLQDIPCMLPFYINRQCNDTYITKPIDIKTFEEQLHKYLS